MVMPSIPTMLGYYTGYIYTSTGLTRHSVPQSGFPLRSSHWDLGSISYTPSSRPANFPFNVNIRCAIRFR